jgi:transcriptional regulator with XRE-family HTH domain
MINAEQIRAARALLDWSTADLAKQAGLTVNGINKIERGHVQAHRDTLAKLNDIFVNAGIEFLPNSGLRKKDNLVEIYEGAERFNEFYNFLYEHLRTHGGAVCLSVTDERLLAKYREDPTLHYQRMQDLCDRGVVKSFRILANKSDFASKYPYNTYKWQPEASVAPTAFYTFGDCLALVSFTHSPPPYVVVLQSAPLAESYRQAFDIAWTAAKEPPPSQMEKK